MPQLDKTLLPDRQNKLIYDELNYNRRSLAEEHHRLMSTMTTQQRRIYDRIMNQIEEHRQSLFLFYLWLWRNQKDVHMGEMSASLRSRGEIVLTVASSGIAALLTPDERTTQSRFSVPINVDEYSTCDMKPKYPLSDLIRRVKLIIWDEVPMMHKHYFEVVDRTLQDIMHKKTSHLVKK